MENKFDQVYAQNIRENQEKIIQSRLDRISIRNLHHAIRDGLENRIKDLETEILIYEEEGSKATFELGELKAKLNNPHKYC